MLSLIIFMANQWCYQYPNWPWWKVFPIPYTIQKTNPDQAKNGSHELGSLCGSPLQQTGSERLDHCLWFPRHINRQVEQWCWVAWTGTLIKDEGIAKESLTHVLQCRALLLLNLGYMLPLIWKISPTMKKNLIFPFINMPTYISVSCQSFR